MTQYTSNCFDCLSKAVQLFLCFVMLLSLNVAYAVTKLSEDDIGFAKVSGKVGTVEKTAGCLIVFSPQDKKSVKKVFCRYELDKQDKFKRDDDEGGIITVRGKTASDAALPEANTPTDFAMRITAFLNKTGYQLPVGMTAAAIATFMSNPQFPNGNLTEAKKPTKIYILERDYLAENTDDKTFAFFVHNLIQRRGTLTHTETGIEALKKKKAFKGLTNLGVRKLLTLELDSIASQDDRLKILNNEDVKAILLDKNAQHLLKDDEVVNVLGTQSVPTVLANPAVQRIFSNEDAIAKLSDKNTVAFLNQDGVPELLNSSTFQTFLQQNQSDLENNLLLLILKFAIFVGSQLEVVAILIAALVILFFQWRLSRKTVQSFSSLEKQGKHGNQKILQSISTVENQINADSEMRQDIAHIKDRVDEKSGITAVNELIQVLSRCGLSELKDIEQAELLLEWAKQLESQNKMLVVLPPSDSRLKLTLREKQETVENLKEQHSAGETEVGLPVEKSGEKPKADEIQQRPIGKPIEILNELEALVHKDFQSEAEMWKYFLETGTEKWLDNLLAALQHAFSIKEELEQTQREREQLLKVLSQRFHLTQPENQEFSDWIKELLNQEGTWIWLQPKSIEEFLSHSKTVSEIKTRMSQVSGDMSKDIPNSEQQPVLREERLENEISTDWNNLLNKPFQSVEDMNQQLATLSEKWLNILLILFKRYLSTKAERKKLQNLLLKRFLLSKPETHKLSRWIDELLEQPGRWILLQPDFINELLSSQTLHQLNEQMAKASQDDPVLPLLRGINEISTGWQTFLGMSFPSHEDMWTHLHKASEGWLGNLVAVLKQYQSLKAEQNRLQAVSERFIVSKPENHKLSSWIDELLQQPGKLVLLQPDVINKLLSSQTDALHQLNEQMAKASQDDPVLPLWRGFNEISTGWKKFFGMSFQSHEDMWTHLHKASEGWLGSLVAVLEQYHLLKAEQNTMQAVLSERFIVSQPEGKKFSSWIYELLQQPGKLVLLQPDFVDKLLSSQTLHQLSKPMAKASQDDPVLPLLRGINEISTGWQTFLGKPFQSNEDMWTHLHKASEGWLGNLLAVLKQYQSLKAEQNTMQAVLSERFSPSQKELIEFSLEGFRTQQGIWRWLQLSVIAELLACQHCVAQLKTANESFSDRKNLLQNNNRVTIEEILGLLYMDDVMKYCKALVKQQFPSNDKMRDILLGGNWIHRLLRANDLLQTYFAEQPAFRLLSRHLANATGVLEAMFIEMGIEVKRPTLFEPMPKADKKWVVESSREAKRVLRALEFVKKRVSDRLNPNSPNHCPEFVVDIQTYGFIIKSGNKKPLSKIQVTLTNPSEWK
jgi:hypothetical protein